MEMISLCLRLGILCGVVLGLALALMGLVFLFTRHVAKGLKYLASGLLLPVILVVGSLELAGYFSRSHDASTDQVTLKGRVVDAAGAAVEGATVDLTPLFPEAQTSEPYNDYPRREALSDATGTYELTEVKPLDIMRSVYYLGCSNLAVREQQFFFGQVTASRSPDSGYSYTEPQLTLPLISENRLKQARRALFVFRCFGWGRPEREDLWVPRSEGNVIFLPDITVADEAPKPIVEPQRPREAKQPPPELSPERAVAKHRAAFKRRCEADKQTFGDCYYGSGVQVGAYARFYLGRHYMGKGLTKVAEALFDEIRRDYPDAVNHQGQLLADALPR